MPGSSCPRFIPDRRAERPDFWVRRPDGAFEPPRIIVPGTSVTACALFDHRHDEDALARAWLDAFLWQWRKQSGVHPPESGSTLDALLAAVRADRRDGNGYHGNTQQTLPVWHVPIDGRRWDEIVSSAARARVSGERRWGIIVPVA